MTFSLAGVAIDGFAAAPSFADGVARLTLQGTADASAVGPLAALMPRFHAEVVRAHGREVVVDLLACEFMSSSCFKAFVAWIAQLQDSPPPQQYRVRLVSNPRIHWQRRSLRALSCFAADLITVET
jgi:hypothetical protein